MAITIHSSDRACFFGRTGSGKTTLAKNLLRLCERYAVLDPKHTYREAGIRTVTHFTKHLDRQVIRVPIEAEPGAWYLAINQIWRERNRLIYIDEGTLVNPARTSLHTSLGKAIRTGRERNVGVWFGSQRPKEIPSAVFTEAEHFFVFQLQFEADREKVASFTDSRMEDAIEGLTGHQFVYYNVLSGRMQLMELKLREHKKVKVG